MRIENTLRKFYRLLSNSHEIFIRINFPKRRKTEAVRAKSDLCQSGYSVFSIQLAQERCNFPTRFCSWNYGELLLGPAVAWLDSEETHFIRQCSIVLQDVKVDSIRKGLSRSGPEAYPIRALKMHFLLLICVNTGGIPLIVNSQVQSGEIEKIYIHRNVEDSPPHTVCVLCCRFWLSKFISFIMVRNEDC